MTTQIPLPKELIQLAQAIHELGGRTMLVGGAVRDALMFHEIPKDFDVEVYFLEASQFERILRSFGSVSYVGKHFGVWKLSTVHGEYDFSFPRKENKVGKGHTGFEVTSLPHLTFREAASRRDFTINAIGYDCIRQVWEDPFDGMSDLKNKKLRHIGPAFSEDPLRVLRAMQFCARFELSVDVQTIQLCQKQDLTELPMERLWEEFKKLLLKAKQPSLGLKITDALGVLKYFPELKALMGVPQDPEWHPEGDVWVHTLMVVDEAAKLRSGGEFHDLSLMFGALCHDFGKPATTQFQNGRWRSLAHDQAGAEPTRLFLQRLTRDKDLTETVVRYVEEHLKPALLYNVRDQVSDGAIRRLALKVSIPDLVEIAKADHFGRTTPEAIQRLFPAGEWLLGRAESLQVHSHKPQPLLKGRHLMALGISPGASMGEIIKKAFQAQLDGAFSTEEGAVEWASRNLPCSE